MEQDYIDRLMKEIHARYEFNIDVFQEAFLRNFEANGGIEDFLYCYREILRDEITHSFKNVICSEFYWSMRVDYDVEECTIDYNAEVRKILNIVKVIFPAVYDAYVRYYLHGWMYPDIAELSGLSVSTLRRRFSRINQFLKTTIKLSQNEIENN